MDKKPSNNFLTGINYEEPRKKTPEDKTNSSWNVKRSKTATDKFYESKKQIEKVKKLLEQRKNFESSLPKITKRSRISKKSKKKKKQVDRRKLHKVKDFFKMNEDKLGKIDRNFRNTQNAFRSKNAEFSKTFFNRRKENIESAIENLYVKHEKEREKINKKLKQLEKQKFFRSEIEIREKQLNICKRETDELQYAIRKKKRTLDRLSEKYDTLLQKYDTSAVEENLREKEKVMTKTDVYTMNEKFVTRSLNHMMNSYKSDILSLKIKVQRFKDMMKKMMIEETELKLQEKKISGQVSKLVSKLLREKAKSKKGDNNLELDTLFNENIEDDLSVYEDRITLNNIAKFEKDLEKKKEEKKVKKKKKRDRVNMEKQRKKITKQQNRYRELKKGLQVCEKKIDSLLKVMKISDLMKIESTYEDLQKDEESIKKIIKEHQFDIDITHDKISDLRELYKQESFLPDSMNFIGDEEEKKEDDNRFNVKEKELTMQKNVMLVAENSFRKISQILNNSCSIVSKIMYQLEPKDKTKNIEVDKDNVVEYLSHIGLKLERMLAFINTKSSVTADEQMLKGDMMIVNTNNAKNLYKPDPRLGLRKSNLEIRPDSGKFLDFEEGGNMIEEGYFEAMRTEIRSQIITPPKAANKQEKKKRSTRRETHIKN